MPQLDKFTFASQIVWLFILFFGLYILILKFILPQLLSILRVRRWRLDKFSKNDLILKLLKNRFYEQNNLLVYDSITATYDVSQNINSELNLFIESVENQLVNEKEINPLLQVYSDLSIESQLTVEYTLFGHTKVLDFAGSINAFSLNGDQLNSFNFEKSSLNLSSSEKEKILQNLDVIIDSPIVTEEMLRAFENKASQTGDVLAN